MKKKLGIVALLVLGFILFIVGRFIFIETQQTSGVLKVESSLPASIFIDNVAIGKTPFENEYKAGEYFLKLIPEESATQTASWQKKIKVNKKTLTYVNVEMGSLDISTSVEVFEMTKAEKSLNRSKGEMNIETEPSGAIIYLNNDEKGVSSLYLGDLPAGDHEISVFMPGFFRKTKKIHIVPGYRLHAYIKLAVDPNQSPSYRLEEPIKMSSPSAEVKSDEGKKTVVINDTPTGWLRVREDATINASESGKVNPGDSFEIMEEKDGWYKITFEGNKTGWISSEYTRVKE